MKEGYARRKGLAEFDARFQFAPGDKVLLRVPRTTKLQVGASGPYLFVKYTRRVGVTAIIRDVEGREKEVSMANLLPVASGSW